MAVYLHIPLLSHRHRIHDIKTELHCLSPLVVSRLNRAAGSNLIRGLAEVPETRCDNHNVSKVELRVSYLELHCIILSQLAHYWPAMEQIRASLNDEPKLFSDCCCALSKPLIDTLMQNFLPGSLVLSVDNPNPAAG